MPLSTSKIAFDQNVSASAVARWITDGLELPSGRRLRLKASRIGGRWSVDPADLDAFTRELTAAYVGPEPVAVTA